MAPNWKSQKSGVSTTLTGTPAAARGGEDARGLALVLSGADASAAPARSRGLSTARLQIDRPARRIGRERVQLRAGIAAQHLDVAPAADSSSAFQAAASLPPTTTTRRPSSAKNSGSVASALHAARAHGRRALAALVFRRAHARPPWRRSGAGSRACRSRSWCRRRSCAADLLRRCGAGGDRRLDALAPDLEAHAHDRPLVGGAVDGRPASSARRSSGRWRRARTASSAIRATAASGRRRRTAPPQPAIAQHRRAIDAGGGILVASAARPRAAPRCSHALQPSGGASSAKLSDVRRTACAPRPVGERAGGASAGATAGSPIVRTGMRGDRAPASPWPRAGRRRDRSPAAPARRCGPPSCSRPTSGSARTACPAAGPRLTSTRRTAAPCARLDPRQRALLEAEARRHRRDESPRTARRCGAAEARRQAGARHGVPLVAHAAGVEHERPFLRDGAAQARRARSAHEARLAVRA